MKTYEVWFACHTNAQLVWLPRVLLWAGTGISLRMVNRSSPTFCMPMNLRDIWRLRFLKRRKHFFYWSIFNKLQVFHFWYEPPVWVSIYNSSYYFTLMSIHGTNVFPRLFSFYTQLRLYFGVTVVTYIKRIFSKDGLVYCRTSTTYFAVLYWWNVFK